MSEKNRLPEPIVDYIKSKQDSEHSESYLIPVLQKVQNEFGYLSEENMDEVARLMGIPYAKVSGVATFYHYFNFAPSGENKITVCTGTACYVRGADAVLDRFKEELGVGLNEPTKDGKFSIVDARCVGACGQAPVVVINEKVYGKVSPDDVPDIIAEYRDKS
jgi:NADH-quinone oxidoreductase subunit E/NADP-reducing hydrogenase subunit HndA